MPKLDYKRELKDCYTASAKSPAIVTVPALNFLMVDGAGDPNTAQAYKDAVEALFSLAYTLKFALKRGAPSVDYGVMPLEGRWWVEDLKDLDNRVRWQWTMMIMQPKEVTAALFKTTRQALLAKKPLPALPQVRLEKLREGRVAQILHLGPYNAEKPTIDKLHQFVHDAGYTLRDKHHEIYLSDARKTAPAKLRTILRHPVEKA